MTKFILGAAVSFVLLSCNNAKKEEVPKSADAATEAATTEKKAAPAELLDLSAADGVKQSFAAFSKADVDGMAANFDDNIRYFWSSGDSLIGKKAVIDYYKGRWSVIDSANVSETIVLPLQINETQSKYAPTGKWVHYWGFWHVKYKNGKKIDFWMHNANHFNEAGKVDLVAQFIDRHQILEATKGMK